MVRAFEEQLGAVVRAFEEQLGAVVRAFEEQLCAVVRAFEEQLGAVVRASDLLPFKASSCFLEQETYYNTTCRTASFTVKL